MTAAAGRLLRVVPEPGVTRAGAWVLRMHAVVTGLRGGRRILIAFCLGALASLALPPVYAWPALIPAFTGLVWLTDRRIAGAASAFAVGWWFGLGFFLVGLYWVFNAFAVRGGMFVWIAPFAVLGLAALLAAFPALACLLARLAGRTGVGGVLVFAATWTGVEWLRSWVLTGFPWNLIGSVWAFSDSMIQVTALAGPYGLGLATVAAAAMASTIADRAVPGRRAGVAMIAVAAVLVAIWGGGMVRLAVVGDVGVVDDVRLRLVQPNIPQQQKWQRGLLDAHLDSQLTLGAEAAAQPPTHVLWSESAAPLFLEEDAERRAWIGRFTPSDGLTVLGTLRRSAPTGPFTLYNSLVALDAEGTVVGAYDKVHLVPFGEYMPFRDLVGLGKLTEGTIDFSAGPGLRTLSLPGLPPVGPLICYEVIFPGAVTAAGDRPDWLLNLTNDAWYGYSSGPYQHFAAARLRAVEEGLPLVRIANTGISAIIDPLGRIVGRLGLEETGIVDGPLPRPLAGPTPYARLGDRIVLLLVVGVALMGILIGRRGV